MECKHEPKCHHVVVCADRHSARVIPGSLIVSPGDRIVFEDLEADVQLFFPDAAPIDLESADMAQASDLPRTAVFSVPKDGSVTVQVIESAKRGRYPYAAYCKRVRAFATGNSDPTIIIRTRSGY